MRAAAAQLRETDLRAAFQDLCEVFPRGVFYRRGSFIAFSAERRRQWLDARAALCPGLDAFVEALTDGLESKWFLGDAPAAASDRVGDMNRFRQLLGALFLGLEALEEGVEAEEALERWFAPAPCWLLAGFDPAHVARLNPPLARRAVLSAPPPGLSPESPEAHPAIAAGPALRPLLRRRHLLFWYDDDARARFTSPGPEGFPDALALKLDHADAQADQEVEALALALRARSPHDVNALIFHLLAWISWSEPVERSPGRPNPGFEPLRHFVDQLCRQKARWVAARLPASAPRDEDEIALEMIAEIILMCQADRFRAVINLSASLRAALDRLAKTRLEAARAAAVEEGRLGGGAPLDWLVARFAAEDRERLHKIDEAQTQAELRAALTRIWAGLRDKLADLLEEDPARVRLPEPLLAQILTDLPALIVALDRAEPDTLVRWYWLEALGLDEAALLAELRLRALWLGDDENRRWLAALQRAPTLGDQRRALGDALKDSLLEWI